MESSGKILPKYMLAYSIQISDVMLYQRLLLLFLSLFLLRYFPYCGWTLKRPVTELTHLSSPIGCPDWFLRIFIKCAPQDMVRVRVKARWADSADTNSVGCRHLRSQTRIICSSGKIFVNSASHIDSLFFFSYCTHKTGFRLTCLPLNLSQLSPALCLAPS